MPIYEYEEILPDGCEREPRKFSDIQGVNETPHARHPDEGYDCRRVISAPARPKPVKEFSDEDMKAINHHNSWIENNYRAWEQTGEYNIRDNKVARKNGAPAPKIENKYK